MNSWQKGKLLVACHDAGGAEIISAWIRKNCDIRNVHFLLEGPAIRIFQGKMPGISIVSRERAFHCLAAYNHVLTGTGWGSDLEKKVIALCKSSGVCVASYLDHWTTYQERFTVEGRLELPDEIWVGDEYAYDLARNTFSDVPIKLEPNQYLFDAAAYIKAVMAKIVYREGEKVKVLYTCEPRTMKYGDADYWGYTEYQALEEYLRFLSAQPKEIGEIRVRLHPSEAPGKYDAVLFKFQSVFTLSESLDNLLYDDCAWADWVVGCDSMAMVVALLAGKKVFSCIPQGGRKLILPYKEIIRLFN